MKAIIRIPLLLLSGLILLMLAGCVPIPLVSLDQGLVIGQDYRLSSGNTLNHDLTIVGASASLDQGSIVNGDIAVIGATVTIDGKVNGSISAVGSDVSLGDHAVVTGSVESVGASVRKSAEARVEGKSIDNTPAVPPITTLHTPAMQVSVDPITAPLMAIFQSLALAALAVVANLFAPRPMERAGQAAMAAPAASGGVGCLTILLLVVMGVTLILLPVSFLGFMAAGIAMLFGWLALGLLIGRQIAVLLKQSWSDPVSAGAGTLAITLLSSLLGIIPCIGWVAGALAGLVALGAVVLTRFGTQLYPAPYSSAAAAPVAPMPRPGPYGPPPTYPNPQPEARVYPPESDQPGENPPAGPESNTNA